MALKRAVIVASFGDRDRQIHETITNLMEYCDLPIHLVTDRTRQAPRDRVVQRVLQPGELRWREHRRWGVRNANIWLARAALEATDYSSVMCLNDDMRIVHHGFLDGFALAEKFGVCVPSNPRIYVRYNAMGADATDADLERAMRTAPYAPACNVSPLFASQLPAARTLLQAYLDELETCMRGTLAIWFASWRTGITPVYLPEFWCVCEGNARHIRDYRKRLRGKTHDIPPMMLHVGQKGVREVFDA